MEPIQSPLTFQMKIYVNIQTSPPFAIFEKVARVGLVEIVPERFPVSFRG
jgi:hypothetical protein